MNKSFSSSIVLLGLAVSTFAIGITEFISVGILPIIAQDLNVSVALAGLTVSLYALGVTIGGPIITSIFSSMPKKQLILGILAVLLIGNILSAVSTNFTMLLISRIIASLSHGIFMSIGSVIATQVVPKDKQASSIAIMFSGLTISTIIGVPFGTFIGNMFGWRMTFVFIVLIGSVAFVLNLLFFPSTLPKENRVKLSSIFSIFSHKRILFILAMTALGYGGTFVPFTYLSPILDEYAHFTPMVISWILVLYGITIAVGNVIGGKVSNKNPIAALFWIFLVNTVLLVVLSLSTQMGSSTLILISVLLMGLFAFMNVPGLQLYVMSQSSKYITSEMSMMASALNISSFNLGITLGSYLGQLTVQYLSLSVTGYIGALVLLFSTLIAFLLWKTDPQANHKQSL